MVDFHVNQTRRGSEAMSGPFNHAPDPPWAKGEHKGCDSVLLAARVFFRCSSPRTLLLIVLVVAGGRVALGDLTVWDPLLAAGIFVLWAFQEWWAHRHILHSKPRRLFGREVDLYFARKHRAHHREPWRLEVTLLPLRVVLVALPFAVLFWWLVMPTPALAATAMLAYAAMALLYEWTHYLTHTPYVPRTALYRRICKAHRLHHFKNENYWLGFIVPFVDDLFGTSPNPADVEKSPTVKTLGVDHEDPNAFLI
jgi:hypothetical protein